jgi:hypothetical protein
VIRALKRHSIHSVLLAACGLLLAACALPPERPDNGAALADVQAGRGGDEVVVEGVVTRVYRPSQGPFGTHEEFEIRISAGVAEQDILVADNITIGVPAPVHRGDDVIVKGVLEIDPQGPVIHWTHHDPRFRHPAGFVEVGGKKYD